MFMFDQLTLQLIQIVYFRPSLKNELIVEGAPVLESDRVK